MQASQSKASQVAVFVGLVTAFTSAVTGLGWLGQAALSVINAQYPQPAMMVSQCQAIDAKERRVARYIAAHWKVPAREAVQMVQTSYIAAAVYKVDPVMLLAVAGKESSFRQIGNPDGGDDPMRPYGIMQVTGKWHAEKFEGGVHKTTLSENIFIGARVVREYLDREKGDVRYALMRYNGTRYQNDRYYQGVTGIQQQLVLAMADKRWDA
ncbi:transglycosylase [Novimethylophilus kurashikiensis]|uniref:Transglycosylase n=1 Tax=Novimethylophilus kurashikiensis TaxID=1825523 RepID=A0A2R5F8J7_9PROT|nr:transglycosylase SLT domain-containing protein [Novimethylophilus kurashikiensis]GBG14546.1 transglycosylase [Novimethylophilus kurashikiensis]